MKKIIPIIFLFLISLSFVSALNYTKSDALSWLNSNTAWATAPIEEVAFSLLTLDSNNYDTSIGLNFLKSRKDSSSGCYSSIPQGACTSKDTALAALALSQLGESITPQLQWINLTLKQAQVQGQWIIQIIPGTSTLPKNCTFTHEQSSKTIIINQPSQWISIQDDLEITINEPLEKINVNCDLASNTKISLIRQVVDLLEFHIIEEKTSNNAELTINNACYSTNPTDNNCDTLSSFYVSWVLNKLDQDISTLPYLEDLISSNSNNLYYAMLQSISSNQNYINYLVQSQNPAGYWGYTTSNIYSTSFVIDSLKDVNLVQYNITSARNWLGAQQITTGPQKGSWNGNVLDTAVAVYLGLTVSPVATLGATYCGDGILQTPNAQGVNEECDYPMDTMCPGQCRYDCKCPTTIGCNSDSDCTNVGEVCNLTSSQCQLRAGYCINSNQCDQDEYCDTTTNICKSLSSCISDDDCSIGEECDLLTNTCKPITSEPSQPEEPAYNEEFDCSNGIDEDEDGYIDCEDEDCQHDSACKQASYWWVWLIIIIVLLIIIVLAYFYLSKQKKPKERPSFLGGQLPPSQPQKPAYQPPKQYATKSRRDEELEKELDKSIKEAQNLLKKK